MMQGFTLLASLCITQFDKELLCLLSRHASVHTPGQPAHSTNLIRSYSVLYQVMQGFTPACAFTQFDKELPCPLSTPDQPAHSPNLIRSYSVLYQVMHPAHSPNLIRSYSVFYQGMQVFMVSYADRIAPDQPVHSPNLIRSYSVLYQVMQVFTVSLADRLLASLCITQFDKELLYQLLASMSYSVLYQVIQTG
ncbi:hypothetical protein DPMN_126333 [Dreissena polymorpha]|uniref:Uncharacterized protein n=1 Tax=Dreissena polymorpha TaxID=45954 RepID=A0A9D4JUD4_DREPO|nr:hypothetical protein DPMN_126333 [Dreissena polymorpha]